MATFQLNLQAIDQRAVHKKITIECDYRSVQFWSKHSASEHNKNGYSVKAFCIHNAVFSLQGRLATVLKQTFCLSFKVWEVRWPMVTKSAGTSSAGTTGPPHASCFNTWPCTTTARLILEIILDLKFICWEKACNELRETWRGLESSRGNLHPFFSRHFWRTGCRPCEEVIVCLMHVSICMQVHSCSLQLIMFPALQSQCLLCARSHSPLF